MNCNMGIYMTASLFKALKWGVKKKQDGCSVHWEVMNDGRFRIVAYA